MAITQNMDYNLFTFLLIIATLATTVWLAMNDLKSGAVYLSLIILTVASLFFVFLFVKEQSNKYGLHLPFEKSHIKAFLKFNFGLLIPLILIIFTPGAKALMPPGFLYSAGGETSFTAVKTADSPFWNMYIIGPTAGVQEELWSAAFWIVGLLIGYLIVLALGISKSKWGTRLVQFLIAAALVAAYFTIMHNLNPFYDSTAKFISALVFRVVMTGVMFFLLGMEFTIGYHIGNNFAWLGFSAVAAGLLSIPGIIILVVYLLMWYWLIREWKLTGMGLRDIFSKDMLPRYKGG